jgi:acetoacetyl-CoA synthetase
LTVISDETEAYNNISYKGLYSKVAKCAKALRSLGVQKGDTVAGLVANSPEAIIAALATASIGAVWSSASPDFGATVSL